MEGMCAYEMYLGKCTCIKHVKECTALMYLRIKNFKVFFAKKQSDRDSPKGSGLGTHTSPTSINKQSSPTLFNK